MKENPSRPTLRPVSVIASVTLQATALILLYVILLLVLPVGRDGFSAYHMSSFEYKVIRFGLSLPTMLVWYAAFIGFAALQQYAYAIRQTAEGAYYARLATGITWLAWSLPITGIASLILSSIAYKWPGFVPASIIIKNYIGLILPLVAFSIIGVASRDLVAHAKVRLSLASARIIILLFLIAGVLYCYLTFRHFDLAELSSTANPYHLPIWIMVITVIVPYLYAWFIGILATYEITLFSRQVKGILYRRALQLVATGLSTIIISSIALQYMNGVSPHSGHIVFDFRLVAGIAFHVIGGAGFLLLAVGVTRLKRIEEV